MAIRTQDGKRFSGPDARAIVRAMRDEAHMAPSDWRAYMQDVAARVKLWNGAHVSTNSSHWFLIDLETAGLIHKAEPYQLQLL